MASLRRISVRHEDVFPRGVLFLGVEPAIDFELQAAARQSGNVMADVQTRQKETGVRVWSVSVFDPEGDKGKRELTVKIAADYQPVPDGGIMSPVVFDGMEIVPWVKTTGTRQSAELSFWSTGFRSTATRPAEARKAA